MAPCLIEQNDAASLLFCLFPYAYRKPMTSFSSHCCILFLSDRLLKNRNHHHHHDSLRNQQPRQSLQHSRWDQLQRWQQLSLLEQKWLVPLRQRQRQYLLQQRQWKFYLHFSQWKHHFFFVQHRWQEVEIVMKEKTVSHLLFGLIVWDMKQSLAASCPILIEFCSCFCPVLNIIFTDYVVQFDKLE